ncbi:uncharacterized protein F5147DRAFT_790642 [Suillus discolor]|uniref:ubiquitinyl hydrolase 1 n=1 Tax=Suillus discolor TaxID=1912936 RepID=A0A9P7ETE6_9AGAM|nr:uncharacterized protein F5147DRAFT_790642 [Suillus discolor]KAG2087630.1 hypothetical protein F5147DRAFT_790642 [Suillus discolor]
MARGKTVPLAMTNFPASVCVAPGNQERLVLSKLPSLSASFPATSTLLVRLFNLLEGSDYSTTAVAAVQRLLRLPQSVLVLRKENPSYCTIYVSRSTTCVVLVCSTSKIMLPIINMPENVFKLKRRSRIWLCPTAAFTSISLHAANPFRTNADRLKEPKGSLYPKTLDGLGLGGEEQLAPALTVLEFRPPHLEVLVLNDLGPDADIAGPPHSYATISIKDPMKTLFKALVSAVTARSNVPFGSHFPVSKLVNKHFILATRIQVAAAKICPSIQRIPATRLAGAGCGGDDLELAKLAQTSWDGYMKRNDSVIVVLFQGQYQSTLVYPGCEKVSITFDPFMYLNTPPIDSMTEIKEDGDVSQVRLKRVGREDWTKASRRSLAHHTTRTPWFTVLVQLVEVIIALLWAWRNFT